MRGGRVAMRCKGGRGPLAAFAVAAILLSPAPSAAQGIEGSVRLSPGGAPLPGVLVSARTPTGDRVRAELSDSAGVFSLELPPGRYELTAERIGLAELTTGPVDVVAEAWTQQLLEMEQRPISIAGVVVDSRVRSCPTAADEAVDIQRWWSEISTALRVSSALQDQEMGRFLVRRFERVLDEDADDIVAEQRRWEVRTTSRPFTSVPVDELLDHGFVVGPFGANRSYFGPDAEVILSDRFLSSHCFTLATSRDREGEVSLRFRPNQDGAVVDIEGDLWVDTRSSELTALEFAYVNMVGPEAEGAGGRIEFAYLPSGAWVVSDWHIRLAMTGMRGRGDRLEVTGYREGGASVTPITQHTAGGPAGAIRGTVEDGLRGGAVAGAEVFVLGTGDATSSAAGGEFEFLGLPVGEHVVTFTHPDLSRWGVDVDPQRVRVSVDQTTEMTLRLPSFDEIAETLCLDAGSAADAVLAVTVVDEAGLPIPGEAIQVVFETRSGASGTRHQFTHTTDERGSFASCGVPGDVDVTLLVRGRDGWAVARELRTERGLVTHGAVRVGTR